MTTESDQIAAIYEAYPRKVGRLAAIKAIQKAVSFLSKSENITPLEARRKLYRATILYWRSPQGQNSDRTMIPHPATWYNRGSYLDDPKEWQHVNGGFTRGSVPTGKADGNLGILAKIINEGKHSGGDGQDGELQAGAGGRDDAQKLLLGP